MNLKENPMKKDNGGQVDQRQNKRMMPAIRRQGIRAQAAVKKVQLTVGDLIAATFDTVGTEARSVAKVLTSRDMYRLTDRRIVFV